MEPLAVACVALGLLVILGRAPLIVAPEATLQGYRKLLSSTARTRGVGVVVLTLGLAIVIPAWGTPRTLVRVLAVLGWLLCFGGALLLASPSAVRRTADDLLRSVEEGVDEAFLRLIGVIAVAIGAALIYAGVRLL